MAAYLVAIAQLLLFLCPALAWARRWSGVDNALEVEGEVTESLSQVAEGLRRRKKKCTPKKVESMRKAFARLGGLGPTDFEQPKLVPPLTAEEHASFRVHTMHYAGELPGIGAASLAQGARANRSLARGSCAGQVYSVAAAADESGLSDVESLASFHQGGAAWLERVPVHEDQGGSGPDVAEGAPDMVDRDEVGWHDVEAKLIGCSKDCAATVMAPRVQSLVYAFRKWATRKGSSTAHLLVADPRGKLYWLDFRTLQDFIREGQSTQAWGLFLVRAPGAGAQEGPGSWLFSDLAGGPLPCDLLVEASDDGGGEGACSATLKAYKRWRNRAATAVPTDFLQATVMDSTVEQFQKQEGPTCAAQAVANVLNGMMRGQYVAGQDVLDYYSAKKRDKGLVWGEARKVTKTKGNKTVKTTAKVGNGNVLNALRNCGARGSAMSYKVRRGTLAEKKWLLRAKADETARQVVLPGRVMSETLYSKATSASIRTGEGHVKEWAKLKMWLDHCAAGNCGIVFHLTNHYAPIYGYRELNGQVQILVPSAGQSPRMWQDFRTVRETILKWTGHAFMVGFMSKPRSWTARQGEGTTVHEPPAEEDADVGDGDVDPGEDGDGDDDAAAPAEPDEDGEDMQEEDGELRGGSARVAGQGLG